MTENLRGRLPLTRTQRLILDFLQAFITEHRYAPSFDEIARHFGYRSLATVHEHLESLRHKGWIRVEPHVARGITIKPPLSRVPQDVRDLATQVLCWTPDMESHLFTDASVRLAHAVERLAQEPVL